MTKCSHAKNQENPLSGFWEKRVTDGRKDEQMGPFSAEPGVQKEEH